MKVGILMSDFSCSQLSFYVIRNVNEACNTSPKNDYIGFFENLSGNVIEPSFCLMNMSEVWGFEPKENELFIFPSWLDHMVSQNLSNEDRISISFKLMSK